MGGADFVVDYSKDGWQKEVLKFTGGRGVDVVYDPVGRIKGAIPFSLVARVILYRFDWFYSSLIFADALKCVVWGGRALVIGFAGGEIEKVRGVTSREKGQSSSVASTATS